MPLARWLCSDNHAHSLIKHDCNTSSLSVLRHGIICTNIMMFFIRDSLLEAGSSCFLPQVISGCSRSHKDFRCPLTRKVTERKALPRGLLCISHLHDRPIRSHAEQPKSGRNEQQRGSARRAYRASSCLSVYLDLLDLPCLDGAP